MPRWPYSSMREWAADLAPVIREAAEIDAGIAAKLKKRLISVRVRQLYPYPLQTSADAQLLRGALAFLLDEQIDRLG